MTARLAARALLYGPGSSGAYALVEVQMRTAPGGANVATGGTALGYNTAAAYPATRAFDGVTSGGDGQTWAAFVALTGTTDVGVGYQFATPQEIVEWVLYPRTDLPAQAPSWVLFQSTDDFLTWYDEFAAHPATWAGGVPQTFTKPGFAASDTTRYVELMLFNSNSTITAVAELALKNGGSNLLTGGTPSAFSSWDASFLPPNALDGNAATSYITQAGHARGWWRYDYGAGGGLTVNPPTCEITPRSAALDQSPTMFLWLRGQDGINFLPAGYRKSAYSWPTAAMRTFDLSAPDPGVHQFTLAAAEVAFETDPRSRVTFAAAEAAFEANPAMRISFAGIEVAMDLTTPAPSLARAKRRVIFME